MLRSKGYFILQVVVYYRGTQCIDSHDHCVCKSIQYCGTDTDIKPCLSSPAFCALHTFRFARSVMLTNYCYWPGSHVVFRLFRKACIGVCYTVRIVYLTCPRVASPLSAAPFQFPQGRFQTFDRHTTPRPQVHGLAKRHNVDKLSNLGLSFRLFWLQKKTADISDSMERYTALCPEP